MDNSDNSINRCEIKSVKQDWAHRIERHLEERKNKKDRRFRYDSNHPCCQFGLDRRSGVDRRIVF